MDKQVIQSVGFRNIEENGEITGFQRIFSFHNQHSCRLSGCVCAG